MKHLFDTGKVIYEGTTYGNGDFEIVEATEEGRSVRILLVDGARESASYTDPLFRNDLVFKYANGFHEVIEANPYVNSALLIGGAGFSYPKSFISKFPKKTMDVVEIDPVMVDLAFRFFYLDELYKDYDLESNHRLNIYIMDGNDYLKENTKKYDIIFHDAYIAYVLDSHLLSREGISLVKKNLQPNGIYVINLITSLSGHKTAIAPTYIERLKEFFKYTVFKRCTPDIPANHKQNCLLICSDFPL